MTDPLQRQRIIEECLLAYLHDRVDAWSLEGDGTYKRVSPDGSGVAHSAQAALVARYGGISE